MIFASFKEPRHSPQICLSYSRIPRAKQDTFIGPTLTLSPLPKLPCFQKPIPDTVESVGAHSLVSVTRLQWREPTQNLRILIGSINDPVEAPYYVAGVCVVVADGDRLRMCRLGHDVRLKRLVECTIEVETVL